MMLITTDELMAATGCTRERAALFLPFLQGAMKAYQITTPQRMAGFLSQIAHESRRLKTLDENLNYSVEALLTLFRRHRISEEDAKRYGRKPGRKADQQAIANCVYGGAWGKRNLGNLLPGDGWKYKGRGLKQLTGRDNYKRCGEALGEDFLTHPDRLLLPVNAALSAGWFWQVNGLNRIADTGNVREMTRVVNGGVNGLAERTALYGRGLEVFA